MGESATAIGSGRAVCPMPASSRRPRPTARSGSWPGVLRVRVVPLHRDCQTAALGGRHAAWLCAPSALASPPDRGRWESHADREPSPSIPSRATAARPAACLPAVWQSAASGGRHAAWLRAPSALASPPDRGRWEPHADREPSSSIPSRAAAATRRQAAACLPGSDQCCGKDRAVSSRQLRRRTIGPGRGEGRALRFVPPEVPRGPHRPPTAMCGA